MSKTNAQQETSKDFIMIPVDRIRNNPLNKWKEEDLQDLKDSIHTFGIQDPVAVIRSEDEGYYTLISGQRRVSAFRELYPDGMVPCHIVGDATMPTDIQQLRIDTGNLEARESSIEEKNIHRADVINTLMHMVDNGELEQRQLANEISKYLKLSPRYSRFWRTVFVKGTNELKEMVTNTEISPKDGAKLAVLPVEEQNKAIQKIKNDVPVKQAIAESTKTSKPHQEEIALDDIDEIMSKYNLGYATGPSIDEAEEPIKEQFDTYEPGDDESDTINVVIEWCRKIVSKDNPTQEEWDAINACKEVAECFQ
ncbi:ParB N-terminal domain-containing protein [Ruminococcus sp. CLA-AA-H200]|uniref:ParB N-terminal domain-containing protein n=1 Tax=Ruminococcus turbiniformis TaxID=2881258 RepID=A0ABS8FX05_9FIRM|nr:ParB N-terminal domain-containing protein [Ruminococcus turbiniformis]MCC2254583.1 ParB N-terminal domain-containing protein [Ruminococcus turbiniformis]